MRICTPDEVAICLRIILGQFSAHLREEFFTRNLSERGSNEALAGLEGQGGPHCRWSCPGGAFGQERWETLLVAKTTSWRCLRGRLMIGIFVAVAVSRRDGGGGLSGLWFAR